MTISSKQPLALSHYESASCDYFSAKTCSSCSLLAIPSGARRETKLVALRDTLARHHISPEATRIHPLIIPSHPWGSRNKVKMSVTGSMDAPVIGIVRSDLSNQDLSECPLMPKQMIRFFTEEAPRFIKEAGLIPYDIAQRTGELKGIIFIINHSCSQGIIRFIIRSSESIPRIKKLVPALQAQLPLARVISCNIQPLPAAILEGPEEVVLTAESFIEEEYGPIRLRFAPSSFIQVTHEGATALYGTAATYAQERSFSHALDLFCGVGGFSFSIAPFVSTVTGVELSPAAIESATRAQLSNGAPHATFHCSDVERFLEQNSLSGVDLVVTNPPRRGLSQTIIGALLRLQPQSILYSSCNPDTFARDVQMLTAMGSYTLKELYPFDMFPLTHHCEVLGILEAASHTP